MIKFVSPFVSVSRTINLQENEDPHNYILNVSFSDSENKRQETKLFSYTLSVENSANQVIEKKSSFFTYNNINNKTQDKKESIILLSLNEVPSGSYIFNLTINPQNNLPKSIRLNEFNYTVNSKTRNVNWLLSLSGLLVFLISALMLRKELNTRKNHSMPKVDTDSL